LPLSPCNHYIVQVIKNHIVIDKICLNQSLIPGCIQVNIYVAIFVVSSLHILHLKAAGGIGLLRNPVLILSFLKDGKLSF